MNRYFLNILDEDGLQSVNGIITFSVTPLKLRAQLCTIGGYKTDIWDLVNTDMHLFAAKRVIKLRIEEKKWIPVASDNLKDAIETHIEYFL